MISSTPFTPWSAGQGEKPGTWSDSFTSKAGTQCLICYLLFCRVHISRKVKSETEPALCLRMWIFPNRIYPTQGTLIGVWMAQMVSELLF